MWYLSVPKIICCSIWSAGRELKPLNIASICTAVTCLKTIPVVYHIKSYYLPFPYLQLLSYPGSLCVLHSYDIWYEWKFVFIGSAWYLGSILTYTWIRIDHIHVWSLYIKLCCYSLGDSKCPQLISLSSFGLTDAWLLMQK